MARLPERRYVSTQTLVVWFAIPRIDTSNSLIDAERRSTAPSSSQYDASLTEIAAMFLFSDSKCSLGTLAVVARRNGVAWSAARTFDDSNDSSLQMH